MRVVFAGGTELGWRCCEALLADGHEVPAILSVPQTITLGRAELPNVTHRDFRDLADRAGAELLTPVAGRLTAEDLGRLSGLRADALVAAGWFHVIPRRVREAFPLGAVGLHGSLLPRYRGGAPLVWAMINGEVITGVSLFLMSDETDAGPVIDQRTLRIGYDDTIADLSARAAEASVSLLRQVLPAYAAGDSIARAQDPAQATSFPVRRPVDGRLDWSGTSRQVYDWVRAQTRPYPGAFFEHDGLVVRVWRVEEAQLALAPGRIQKERSDVFVGTSDRAVKLVDISIDDRELDRESSLALLREGLPR